MNEWKDCIVATGAADSKSSYVWVAYQTVKPYLPVAIADSARELAEQLGVKRITVAATVSRYRSGKIKRPRYMCVYIGDLGD